jgi:hypothetical protein
MAVFTLDATNRATIFSSLLSAMSASGMSPVVVYQSAGTLVWSSNRSAKLIRLDLNNDADKRPTLIYGDSHTGGGSLSNAVTVLPGITGDTYANWWFVANETSYAMVAKAPATPRQLTMFFSKTSATPPVEVIGACGAGSPSVRYVPSGAAIYLSGAPYHGSFAIKNAAQSYYMMCEALGLDSGYGLLFTGLSGLRLLCRDSTYVAGMEVYGNDAVLPGGTVSLPGGYTLPSLYMPNGASWTP